jgi:chromosome segregation ATPase
MKDNSVCDDLRNRIETLNGQANLLQNEIRDRKNKINSFKNKIENAKDNYKNLATEYGVSLSVGAVSKKISENLITMSSMVSDRVGAPSSREVENALNDYNSIKFQLEDKIEEFEKEIRQIGRDINKIQTEKEKLVEKMRHAECYKR